MYLLAAWRKGRRSTLRYQLETQRIEKWLAAVIKAAKANPALATEITECQRVVKGYSDTHARGLRNFKILMDIVAQQGNKLAPLIYVNYVKPHWLMNMGKNWKNAVNV
ncbi:hypothetical protein LHK12_13840 [Providencia rettgeri]|nr:hypothetical protein [Providencia rettgeri]